MDKILILNERDFRSKKKMLSYIAVELAFPEYFGQNLDALMDCLRDIDTPTNIALVPADTTSKAWFRDICETVLDAADENANLAVFRPAAAEETLFPDIREDDPPAGDARDEETEWNEAVEAWDEK